MNLKTIHIQRIFSLLMVSILLIGCTSKPIPVTGDEPPAAETVVPAEDGAGVPQAAGGLLQIFLPNLFAPQPSPTPTPRPGNPGPTLPAPKGQGWFMAAGNAERSSWSAEEVSGNLSVEWYVPVEAYIPQHVQLIATDGLVFVTTSRGLLALDAASGALAWRFDTQLPLGNAPTVVDGVAYVGGFDRKLHALDISSGTHLWSYDGAGAGYSTNPLIVDGKVILGNRDGAMYAIGANGTARQGQLIWKYQTGGMIDVSAAYANNRVYFASNDSYAYALDVVSGDVMWKSQKLASDGFQSYWPVVYGDKVIFTAASTYRTGFDPGTSSLKDAAGNAYGKIFDIERDDIFSNAPNGTLIGAAVGGQDWANGKQVLDASRITNYLEVKPWHRTMYVLNQNNGSEYTFDSDGDGRSEYLPVLMWGTQSGNRYPPIVSPDGMLYVSNILSSSYIPQGRVMGWKMGTSLFSQVGGQGAVDEPQAISGGGTVIYRNMCCDRVGDYFSTLNGRSGQFWGYSNTLYAQLPGYDQGWFGTNLDDSVRLQGNYGTANGIYNSHGDQNALVPYGGRLYAHRGNSVIAVSARGGAQANPLLRANTVQDSPSTLTDDVLRARLESEVLKIVEAGHLRPGYYNQGQYGNYSQFANYFENPGDTLYTLATAMPHLSPALQARVRTYLQSEFQTYFDTAMIARIGWANGAARESFPLPPEVTASMAGMGARTNGESKFSWAYPPYNFYALSKYAVVFPESAGRAYDLAKSKLQVPVPASNDVLRLKPYEANAYIAGYIGFLRLQEQAGRTSVDSALRSTVTNELNRLQQLRASTFSKDTPYLPPYSGANNSYHLRTMNVSRNFLFMTPELGDYLSRNALGAVQQALTEYNDIAPYWFATRYQAAVNEGARQNLYDTQALFQAKAYILKQSQAELGKFLDVPAFERGDLIYLQNLITLIEAN